MLQQDPEHTKVIGKWMSAVVTGGATAHPQDLHIDLIDSKWKSRSLWIEGGLKAFCTAYELRELNHVSFTLVLNFSLDSGYELRGINFHTLDELATQFLWTPPSLYLFERGKEPWIQNRTELDELVRNGGMAEELGVGLFGGSVPARKCYYSEVRPPACDEYARSLILVG